MRKVRRGDVKFDSEGFEGVSDAAKDLLKQYFCFLNFFSREFLVVSIWTSIKCCQKLVGSRKKLF